MKKINKWNYSKKLFKVYCLLQLYKRRGEIFVKVSQRTHVHNSARHIKKGNEDDDNGMVWIASEIKK